MPIVEVRKSGRRPALSQYTAETPASIRFHRATQPLVTNHDQIQDCWVYSPSPALMRVICTGAVTPTDFSIGDR